MRITPINQQMNTNRMNQNASVNRSNSTTNMQNPSFGTTIEPNTLATIKKWVAESSDNFLIKYAKDLIANFKKLEKDGHPEDVVSFKVKKSKWQEQVGYQEPWGDEGGFPIFGDFSGTETLPELSINYKGKHSTPIHCGYPSIVSRFSLDGENAGINNDHFGKFLEQLTPKKIEEYRASVIKSVDEKIAFEKQTEKIFGAIKVKETEDAEQAKHIREFCKQ
jgi:hypothetical protein